MKPLRPLGGLSSAKRVVFFGHGHSMVLVFLFSDMETERIRLPPRHCGAREFANGLKIRTSTKLLLEGWPPAHRLRRRERWHHLQVTVLSK